jgi:hypothetical protein
MGTGEWRVASGEWSGVEWSGEWRMEKIRAEFLDSPFFILSLMK